MDEYSVAVDVGGTFTDIVLCNLTTNQQWVHKTPSTSEDPSKSFLTGLREILVANSVDPAQVRHVFHGTTIATNAILEAAAGATRWNERRTRCWTTFWTVS